MITYIRFVLCDDKDKKFVQVFCELANKNNKNKNKKCSPKGIKVRKTWFQIFAIPSIQKKQISYFAL